MVLMPHSTEVDAWASKTSGDDKPTIHKRLISTHVTLTGIRWWDHYEDFHTRLDGLHEDAPNRDFLFPQPNREMTGYYLKPCPNHMALKLLRQILDEMETKFNVPLNPEPSKIYLSTLRVQGPDAALQCGITTDHRQQMAEWATESMTNRYHRNRRELLHGIWQQIYAHFVDESNRYNPGTHPESLYGGKTGISKPDLLRTPERRNLRETKHSGNPPRAARRVRHTDGTTPWETKLDDHYVVWPLGDTPGLKTHWTLAVDYRDGEYRTVAPCGWDYPLAEMEILDNKAKYYSRINDIRPCKHCWEHVTAPLGWEVPDLVTTLDGSDEDSADSAGHEDSDHGIDSDEDAYCIPVAGPTGDLLEDEEEEEEE
jgi:hypothetical protein